MSVSDDEGVMVKMNLKIVYDGVGARASCFDNLGPYPSSAMTIVIGYRFQSYSVWSMIDEASEDTGPSHPRSDLK